MSISSTEYEVMERGLKEARLWEAKEKKKRQSKRALSQLMFESFNGRNAEKYQKRASTRAMLEIIRMRRNDKKKMDQGDSPDACKLTSNTGMYRLRCWFSFYKTSNSHIVNLFPSLCLSYESSLIYILLFINYKYM